MTAAILTPVSLTGAATDPDAFAETLGTSFETYGFAIVADHGIPADLIARADQKMRDYFALPIEIKRKYHLAGTGGARGYTPFGVETAKGESQVDLKEFWHVGRPLPEGHDFTDVMPPNVWPIEVEGFRETFLELFAAFDVAGLHILKAIARYLKLPEDMFADTVRDGNSVLRLIHYPPIPANAPGVRAAAHEDINTITLLLGAEEAGLQLMDKSGDWIAVDPEPGQLVVNIGDMLSRLTNDVLPSTSHKVVNPPPERRNVPRYSMPFFLHFRPDYEIRTLPECVSGARPDRYPESIGSHEFLMQRLAEIKLA
ncbi:MAG: 2-oxoglutarate and iron-dependent oxygenase domain-containing protein [Pacificimonas sp.]